MADNEHTDDVEEKRRELAELRSRVAQLEAEVAATARREPWQARDYYAAYYATTGSILGLFGAAASLLLNIVGSALVGQHPLRLIQVYLTFPMGQGALELETGLAMAIGCCLYLATGMLLGIPFHLLLTWIGYHRADLTAAKRLVIASAFGLAVWLVNYYALLVWLQPALFGGNWIVRLVPWWVAALTHLVFGWTMALMYPLGLYRPYKLQTEHAQMKAEG